MISKTSILSIPSVPGILRMDGDGKKDRPHFWRRSICLFHNFLSQSDAYLNAVDKAGLFMISAEGTDGIDNSIQFCQWYAIQKTVQFMEILFDLPAAAPLQFFVAFIQECQNRLTIPQLQRVDSNVLFQGSKWFIIPDHHPAIVDKELFEKVQAVQRRFSLPTRKTREYPLKGKVYCGCCDHALSRIAQKRPFYMCRHSTADVNSRCRDVRADVAGLEEAVLLTLKKQLEILLPVHEDGTIHLEATAVKCSEYEKQLEVLKDQKQALFERYLLGQIELDTYKSEKAVYDAEILKVKNAYAAVTAQARLKREEQARQSSRQEIVHSIAEADVLTFELTDLLIEKVYVFPDNRIEIVYKVHDLFE